MDKIQLEVKDRNPATDLAKNVKKAGLMPAVLYGHNVKNLHISIAQNFFEKVLRKAGESTIIELKLGDGTVRNVLIQDVQRHYLNSQPIHADFYEVKMSEKLTATVQIEFIGESNAVKALGGTLVKNLTEVEVECLPADLPSHFEVDVTSLANFEDTIEVKDLNVSDKVTINAEPDELVVKVQEPRDVEAELAEPVGEVDVSKVEGVGEDPNAEITDEDSNPKKKEKE